jgi:Ser/Thr protein kinase RdoA (MazF antagonist)
VDAAIVEYAAACFGVTPSDLTPVRGGHFAHSYAFSRDGDYILRIIPPNAELDAASMTAIFAWMAHLSAHGVSVPQPLGSTRGRLVEQRDDYIITAAAKAKGVLAEEVPPAQWPPRLFESLGRTVGRMHALAKGYAPDQSLGRPHWHEIGNCFNPSGPMDAVPAAVRERRHQVVEQVRALSKDRNAYGLIHADLHFGNLFVDMESNTVTLFDFDDCCYGWFAMDVAMSLFDILVLYRGDEREAFAGGFLTTYLRGYAQESPIHPLTFRHLPDFLKMLEIGVYLDVQPHYEPGGEDPWLAAFMPSRERRIVEAVPYVELDFEGILTRTAQ